MTTTLREALEDLIRWSFDDQRKCMVQNWSGEFIRHEDVVAALNAGEGPVLSTLAAKLPTSPSASLRGEPAPVLLSPDVVEQCAKAAENCLVAFSTAKSGILQDQIDLARKNIAAAIRSLPAAHLAQTEKAEPQPDDKQAEIDLCSQLRALSRAEHDDLSIAAEAADEIERLKAEIDKLIEALEPFSFKAPLGSDKDLPVMQAWVKAPEVTVGDIRRARDLLNSIRTNTDKRGE